MIDFVVETVTKHLNAKTVNSEDSDSVVKWLAQSQKAARTLCFVVKRGLCDHITSRSILFKVV